MRPVVMLVHFARLSKCKVGLLLRLGVVALFVLGRLRRAFRLYVYLRLSGLRGRWDFFISLTGQLLYDCATWGRLFVRDNKLTIGSLVNVIVLGLALCNHSETKKKGETKCKIQTCPSVRVGDLLVYSSMVSFNIWGETGFIK